MQLARLIDMDLNLRINIDLAKSTNYIPMGFWVQPVAGDPKKPFYRITDLGIPMVKVEDGSALGYSVYVLNVDVSDDVVPSVSNPQWRLIESTELIYIQQAFIERLWTQMLIAEGAEIGGFEIGNGFLQSKAKDALNINAILLNGLDGSGHLANGNISWDSQGNSTTFGLIKGATAQPFYGVLGRTNPQFQVLDPGWFMDDKKYAIKTNILAIPLSGSYYQWPDGDISYYDGSVRITLPSVNGVTINVFNRANDSTVGPVYVYPPSGETFINNTPNNSYIVGLRKLVSFTKIPGDGWYISQK